MKKGFTLIELLIVMVIISALIAVALPKYNRAMERGRALEGINKVKYAAEYMTAKCLATDGNIATTDIYDVTKGESTFTQYGDASVTSPSCEATVSFQRNPSSGWNYTLTAVSNEDGTTITCNNTNAENHCTLLGLTGEDLLK